MLVLPNIYGLCFLVTTVLRFDLLPHYERVVLLFVDPNECTNGQHQCHRHATCVNTQFSYTCVCNSGYKGNGFDCEKDNSKCDKCLPSTALKMKFSIKNFFSKCDQIRIFLRIWSHLLRKSLMESFIFCAVYFFF